MSDPVQIEELAPVDSLGRYISSRGDANKAAKQNIPFRLFLENIEKDSLSVDTLDRVPDVEMGRIATESLAGRPKPFLGWAVVSVEDAQQMERSVEATPQLDNPYHVDIHLNLPALSPPENIERREMARQHALNLKLHAVYRPWPPQALAD